MPSVAAIGHGGRDGASKERVPSSRCANQGGEWETPFTEAPTDGIDAFVTVGRALKVGQGQQGEAVQLLHLASPRGKEKDGANDTLSVDAAACFRVTGAAISRSSTFSSISSSSSSRSSASEATAEAGAKGVCRRADAADLGASAKSATAGTADSPAAKY